ncbi:DEAD/DEAH box helicase [Crocinitomicaceae bacterium]|nr:DEAD/DEAH box helicase [Crocinitomicaceae bacterium]
MNTRSELEKSIQTGLIEQSFDSIPSLRPKLLTNDAIIGVKVLTTIIEELKHCQEFWFSVAFATSSGVVSLLMTLDELSHKNIKGKILVSQYLDFTEPEALRKLKQYENIELKMATEGAFHSKGYLFKHNDVYDLIIGSSNLTANALSKNKEWNLKLSATFESELIEQTIVEFKKEFDHARPVDDQYLLEYTKTWQAKRAFESEIRRLRSNEHNPAVITPNLMQKEALANLNQLRAEGKNKALLISATGTGKTYLAAFDVQHVKPKRFLFIVHRKTIAEEAMLTFQTLLGHDIKMGIYSGNQREAHADFLFCTVQTLSKTAHLEKFDKHYFDYIVIDETHRAAAGSYQNIIEYFSPDFMLGMTATPERTDGADIFKLFDHNIAYEIRLQKAMEAEMLAPFHYFGISDLTINDKEVDDKTDFNLLTAPERVNRIIEQIGIYGTDDGNTRGLVFCSRNDIAQELSDQFNQRGFNTIALSGASNEDKRKRAIQLLSSNNRSEKLDYIFTVDIFNEGIDIPTVNQIIMLRPTQSAIIFVQQLGRGLRKAKDKSYLTVIDFIGNYSNNYLVPIALYGDTSYNKDELRKLIASGSSMISGTSTVNFDRITSKKIFESIDSANMQLKRDLIKDYALLKHKLGRIPSMVDFLNHGSRDPQLYVNYSKSYYNFVVGQEKNKQEGIDKLMIKLLELFSGEINNTKRIEETILLSLLIEKKSISIEAFEQKIKDDYGYKVDVETIKSVVNNLNFKFIRENKNGKKIPAGDIYNINITEINNERLLASQSFLKYLNNNIFRKFLIDTIEYAKMQYNKKFSINEFNGGFIHYQKYSRKDVFRILNWKENPVALNVGGYIIHPDKLNCPIFVNYHKEDDISSSTKYEDEFLNPKTFSWMSKSKRNLNSPDVKAIKNHKEYGLRIPLFIKKSNDEGDEFYYMGDVEPIENSFEESTIKNDNGKDESVVKLKFKMNRPVKESLYSYLTSASE